MAGKDLGRLPQGGTHDVGIIFYILHIGFRGKSRHAVSCQKTGGHHLGGGVADALGTGHQADAQNALDIEQFEAEQIPQLIAIPGVDEKENQRKKCESIAGKAHYGNSGYPIKGNFKGPVHYQIGAGYIDNVGDHHHKHGNLCIPMASEKYRNQGRNGCHHSGASHPPQVGGSVG